MPGSFGQRKQQNPKAGSRRTLRAGPCRFAARDRMPNAVQQNRTLVSTRTLAKSRLRRSFSLGSVDLLFNRSPATLAASLWFGRPALGSAGHVNLVQFLHT